MICKSNVLFNFKIKHAKNDYGNHFQSGLYGKPMYRLYWFVMFDFFDISICWNGLPKRTLVWVLVVWVILTQSRAEPADKAPSVLDLDLEELKIGPRIAACRYSQLSHVKRRTSAVPCSQLVCWSAVLLVVRERADRWRDGESLTLSQSLPKLTNKKTIVYCLTFNSLLFSIKMVIIIIY